jgi:hypothetical protein
MVTTLRCSCAGNEVVKGAPQELQKRASSAFSCPHLGQAAMRGV